MSILSDLRAEIRRAEEKHGPLPISVPPTFTLREVCAELESTARAEIDSFERFSALAILCEEVGEAARAATTPELRAELLQIAAVALRWIARLDNAPLSPLDPSPALAGLRDFAQRVHHALSDRLKPGQDEIQTIAAILADLDRAEQRRDAAEARLAAILAPVEGVDLEEVLRLDATAARTLTAAEDRDSTLAYAAPVLAREVARRRDLCRRLLPARYIAADGQVMDPDRCTPHALDCAECGRGRAHDEACLGVQPTPAEEVARLRARLAEVERERGETRAEAEELRLTLAAEQGRAEGAPSAGWRSAGGDWLKGRARVRRTNSSWWWFIYAPQPNDHKQTSAEGRESSARAAMLAADKAQG